MPFIAHAFLFFISGFGNYNLAQNRGGLATVIFIVIPIAGTYFLGWSALLTWAGGSLIGGVILASERTEKNRSPILSEPRPEPPPVQIPNNSNEKSSLQIELVADVTSKQSLPIALQNSSEAPQVKAAHPTAKASSRHMVVANGHRLIYAPKPAIAPHRYRNRLLAVAVISGLGAAIYWLFAKI